MTVAPIADPFFGPSPESVPLPHAPLIKVIAQVKFPQIVSISERAGIASFHERIRKEYPLLEELKVPHVNFGPTGITTHNNVHWRFADPLKSWVVSLSTDYVAIETNAYISRDDFMAKLGVVVRSLSETVAPSHIEYLGIRYIDHGAIDEKTEIGTILKPEHVGASAPVRGLAQAITDLRAQTQEGMAAVRWGNMPPQTTYDQAQVPGLETPAWFLDIDASTPFQPIVPFDVRSVAAGFSGLADRAYAIFRWAVNDRFLDSCAKVSNVKQVSH